MRIARLIFHSCVILAIFFLSHVEASINDLSFIHLKGLRLGMNYNEIQSLGVKLINTPLGEAAQDFVVLASDPPRNNYLLDFRRGQLAKISVSMPRPSRGITEAAMEMTLELISKLGTPTWIEIGKFNEARQVQRLIAAKFSLSSDQYLVFQANDIDCSAIIYDEHLLGGKSVFLSFEELTRSPPPFVPSLLKSSLPDGNAASGSDTLPVKDYLRDLKESDSIVAGSRMNHPASPKQVPDAKPVGPSPSEERSSSTQSSIIIVVIVAALGLLWLLIKRRS